MLPLPGLPGACQGQLGGGDGGGTEAKEGTWLWQHPALCPSEAWGSGPELQGVPIEFPHYMLPEDRWNTECLGALWPTTKDNEENKARWLGGWANLPLSEKKHLPWQPQLMKVGTTQERHLNYLLYAQGAAAATSYMGLPIKIFLPPWQISASLADIST